MKHVKKILAFALTLVMAFGFALTAYADDTNEGGTAQTGTAPTTGLTVDPKVTVTGFENGDTVTAYKFISWAPDDQNSVKGWKLATGITGITLENIFADGLDKNELAILASAANIAKMTPVTGNTTAGTETTPATWEMTCGSTDTAGSYLILVSSGNSVKYIYNPAVVSADFAQTATSPAYVALTEDTATIKKQEITVDKKADHATEANNYDDYDVQFGDIVPFTVTVTVPQYNTNWTQPYFAVSDKLSDGLTIKTTPTIEGLTEGEDYTLTDDPDDDDEVVIGDKAFTITFTENYLKNNASAAVDIKYSALVGEAVKDTEQVHEETNKVTLEFSNNPTNSEDHKTIDDETHHYTFAIDATRKGQGSEKTNELIKVGVDADGNPVTVYKEGEVLPTGVQPLAGAEFTLTGIGANGATGENGYSQTATSDADGRIFFNNLEVGTYTLLETNAPAGYIKDQDEHTVVITAEYNDDTTLKSYTITIDGTATSTYTATTNAEKVTTYEAPANGNDTFPINNKQGTELPSTGGIGTTIFYVVGGVMVAGAAIFLLTKRRAAASE